MGTPVGDCPFPECFQVCGYQLSASNVSSQCLHGWVVAAGFYYAWSCYLGRRHDYFERRGSIGLPW